ncbi:hypothetical protein LTR36_010538 [Oleoguttula mirabilis]|uniref:BTB domain-containing protein n=1 Tax=Oleoguttula mirabilis TaxID=1507867 RepID=A0AAV9J4T0_9PEZI|nr:hypothetical protein LTR36_010538 [Oleoguttula mirabilis]
MNAVLLPQKRAAEVNDGKTCSKKPKQEVHPAQLLRTTSYFGRYLDHVTFLVGPKAVPFTVHTGVLIERCPAFADNVLGIEVVRDRAALDGRKVLLEQEEARIFWIFLVWLYTCELVPPPEELGVGIDGVDVRVLGLPRRFADDEDSNTTGSWNDEDLVDIYLFGRRLQIDNLTTVAISTLATENGRIVRTASIAAVRKAFGAGHWAKLMCDYLVDEAEWYADWGKSPRTEQTRDYPDEYISRIEQASRDSSSAAKQFKSWRNAPCRYHVHHGIQEQEHCSLLWSKTWPKRRYTAEIYDGLQSVGTILVGEARYPIVLHKGLISGQSKYFCSAFSGAFAERKTGRIELLKESLDAFLAMVDWVYTQEIRERTMEDRRLLQALAGPRVNAFGVPDAATDDMPDDAASNVDAFGSLGAKKICQGELIELYVLADRERDLANLPSDFFALVVGKMLKLRAQPEIRPVWRLKMCFYHEHTDNAEKTTCRHEWKGYQAQLKAKGTAMEPVKA